MAAKKQTTTFIIAAAAAAGLWYFMKKKGTEVTAKEIEAEPDVETEKADAVVTAPKGQLLQAVEKAQEVASTLKDAAVIVRSGNQTAVVTKGKKRKKKIKCPKTTKEQMAEFCKGLKGKELRQCKRKHRRNCGKVVIEPIQSATFTEYGQYK
jgi:hypothetical protein